MVEVNGEVEQGSRGGLAVNVDSRFVEVPSSGSERKLHHLEVTEVAHRTMRTAGSSLSLYCFPLISKSIWCLFINTTQDMTITAATHRIASYKFN